MKTILMIMALVVSSFSQAFDRPCTLSISTKVDSFANYIVGSFPSHNYGYYAFVSSDILIKGNVTNTNDTLEVFCGSPSYVGAQGGYIDFSLNNPVGKWVNGMILKPGSSTEIKGELLIPLKQNDTTGDYIYSATILRFSVEFYSISLHKVIDSLYIGVNTIGSKPPVWNLDLTPPPPAVESHPTVSLSTPFGKVVKAFDILGRPVSKDVERLPQGIYIMTDGVRMKKYTLMR